MTAPTNNDQPLSILTATATNALRHALRDKKQKPASLIIRRENDLHTFTPANWIKYCVARASHADPQFAAYDGQFLGQIYADVSAMTQTLFHEQLKAIATTVSDNLTHPASSTQHDITTLFHLWQLIPDHIREPLDRQARLNRPPPNHSPE